MQRIRVALMQIALSNAPAAAVPIVNVADVGELERKSAAGSCQGRDAARTGGGKPKRHIIAALLPLHKAKSSGLIRCFAYFDQAASHVWIGDPSRTRTPNLLIRSQLLYPVELRGHLRHYIESKPIFGKRLIPLTHPDQHIVVQRDGVEGPAGNEESVSGLYFG